MPSRILVVSLAGLTQLDKCLSVGLMLELMIIFTLFLCSYLSLIHLSLFKFFLPFQPTQSKTLLDVYKVGQTHTNFNAKCVIYFNKSFQLFADSLNLGCFLLLKEGWGGGHHSTNKSFIKANVSSNWGTTKNQKIEITSQKN